MINNTAYYRVQEAIFKVLYESEELKNMNVSVFDEVPAEEPFPYIVLAEGNESPSHTFCKDGREITFSVHIWSRYKGFKECYLILNEVNKLLDYQDIEIEDFDLIYIRNENSNAIRDQDDRTRHLISDYLVEVRNL